MTVAVAEDDGIQCEKGHIIINNGSISINSTGKAITASYDTDKKYDPYLTINGGRIVITTQDEGIESKSVLTINAGDIQINAKDDAINAGAFIYINGGTIYAIVPPMMGLIVMGLNGKRWTNICDWRSKP